jgi:hypothetical protein
MPLSSKCPLQRGNVELLHLQLGLKVIALARG